MESIGYYPMVESSIYRGQHLGPTEPNPPAGGL